MFKSTFDPKAVQKKHKEIERKFAAIAEALKEAGVNDSTINAQLQAHFNEQLDFAINPPANFIDAIGTAITEPDQTNF